MTTGARTQPQKLQLHTGFLQLKTHTLAVENKGEIVEMGSRSALIVASDGVHSRLYQFQNSTEN
jgi:hypothetical protein